MRNSIISILSKSIHDRNIQTKLINALDIPNEKISITKEMKVKISFQWCYEIKSNNTNVSKDNNKTRIIITMMIKIKMKKQIIIIIMKKKKVSRLLLLATKKSMY